LLIKCTLANETMWPVTDTRPRRFKNTSRDRHVETETTTLNYTLCPRNSLWLHFLL